MRKACTSPVRRLDIVRSERAALEVPSEADPPLAVSLPKYANHGIDLADAALIWLAELIGESHIPTVDQRDFAAFRLKGRKRLNLVRWYRS
jgi:hypothetical protein